jgi:hypothetical protein
MHDMEREEPVKLSKQPQFWEILQVDSRGQRQQPIGLHQRVGANEKTSQQTPGASTGSALSGMFTG